LVPYFCGTVLTESDLSIPVAIICQTKSQDFRISSVAGKYHCVACRETLDESIAASARSHKNAERKRDSAQP
jgi:hypothetical protein